MLGTPFVSAPNKTGEVAAAAAGVEVAAGLAGQIVKLGVGAGSSTAVAPQAKGADARVGLDARVTMHIGRLEVVAGTLIAWEVGGVGSAAALAAQIGRLRLVAHTSGA